jgi:hypothetical protein
VFREDGTALHETRPQPLGAGADEPHVRRDALELVGEDSVQAIALARVDVATAPRAAATATRRSTLRSRGSPPSLFHQPSP